MTQKPDTQDQAQELERLKQEVKEAKDQYLRTLAEMENLRKRMQRESEESRKFAVADTARSLLPIVDSLQQASVAVDKPWNPEAVAHGVYLIHRQLVGFLQEQGIKQIPTVGYQFDPHLHEAVGQAPSQDGQPDGTIAEEIQVGYTMHGKVIRPAMVKVVKATAGGTYEQETIDPDNPQKK